MEAAFSDGPGGALRMELSGRIDADRMRGLLDGFLERIDGREGVRLLAVYHGVPTPTPTALMVEMVMLPRLFGALRRLERVAVVSDRGWIRRAAEVEGAVIPGLDIRAFADEGAATDWLAS